MNRSIKKLYRHLKLSEPQFFLYIYSMPKFNALNPIQKVMDSFLSDPSAKNMFKLIEYARNQDLTDAEIKIQSVALVIFASTVKISQCWYVKQIFETNRFSIGSVEFKPFKVGGTNAE